METAATIKIFSLKDKAVFKKDWLAKLISIPVLAIFIVNFTKIITNVRYNVLHLLISYIYFILINKTAQYHYAPKWFI